VRTVLVILSTLGALPATVAAHQAPDSPEVGTVRGTVTLSARLASRKPRVRLETAYGGAAARKSGPVNELINVVIYLEADSALATTAPASPQVLAMRQHNEAFTPHVLPVLVGSTVEFPNEDPFFHNVFSLARAKTFDLGRYPTGSSKSVRFDRPGIVQVFCHIHSDMRATVIVLENRFFATADSAGRYALDGVPAGEYRLVAWHERIRPVHRRVQVRAGTVTTVDLAIPLPPPTEPESP
jgi:plastocyanin